MRHAAFGIEDSLTQPQDLGFFAMLHTTHLCRRQINFLMRSQELGLLCSRSQFKDRGTWKSLCPIGSCLQVCHADALDAKG